MLGQQLQLATEVCATRDSWNAVGVRPALKTATSGFHVAPAAMLWLLTALKVS